MKTVTRTLTRTLAVAAALLAAVPAHAVLRDHGPADPVLVWPQWYRDLNGTALGLCKSQVVDAAVGSSYCFPLAANPAGFAGNLGDEIFYSNLGVDVQGSNGFTLLYEAALEAAYIPGPKPTHGEEVVFSRLRFLMNNPVPGTYTVIHPYGVQVFPDVETVGKRSVFFTIDLPPGIPGDFAGALNGNIGPFPQTATVDGVPTLVTLTNPATGTTETFLGDGNTPVPFVGSPFGTNFVRVIGPAGSGIGGTDPVTGLPVDTVEQHLGVVLGQVWTAPIATPFQVQRANYTRTATYNGIDVWAQSAPGQNLVVTGTSLASTKLNELPGGTGQYYAHVQQDAAGAPPAQVTVTNYSSNPVNSSSVAVTDAVSATAFFSLVDRTLTVNAVSSDLSSPAMAVLGPYGGQMVSGANGTASYTSPAWAADVAPPRDIDVQSEAGGIAVAHVVVGQVAGINADALIANHDILGDFNGGSVLTFPVMANDTTALGGVVPVDTIVRIVSQGTRGAAVGGAQITYTPNLGASGIETITYMLESASTGYSNVATLEFNLLFVAPAPVAGNDSFAVRTGVAKSVAVLANDTAAAGTTIDVASILETSANATPTAAGLITYTAPTTTTASFTYSVANTAGTRSNNATVTIVSFGVNEAITISRADFTTSSRTWNVRGATNWFSTALTQQRITCWTGTALAPTAATLIGSAPIDTAGAFQLVPGVAGPTPTPSGQRISCQSTGGAIGTFASRNR